MKIGVKYILITVTISVVLYLIFATTLFVRDYDFTNFKLYHIQPASTNSTNTNDDINIDFKIELRGYFEQNGVIDMNETIICVEDLFKSGDISITDLLNTQLSSKIKFYKTYKQTLVQRLLGRASYIIFIGEVNFRNPANERTLSIYEYKSDWYRIYRHNNAILVSDSEYANRIDQLTLKSDIKNCIRIGNF